MKSVKVVILIDRLGRGGIAQVAMNTALTLDRTRFEPILVTTRDKPRNGQDEILRKAGVQLLELDRRSRLQFWSWRPLWEILPTVTILHAHATGSNFWARFWGRLFNVPLIVTQEHTIADEKSLIAHYIDRIFSRFSDKIVTVSVFDRERYIEHEKLPAAKVTALYVGIDVTRFDQLIAKIEARRQIGLPETKLVIGVVGRLAPQKNHIGFLKALKLLPEALQKEVHAVLVGSGDLEAKLRQEVRALGLEDQVVFLGERTDVPVVLHALDLLVLPSHWECLPSVLSEAMVSRCPIVATAVGGVPEIIGNTGWPLVPPGDTNALAQAMAKVLQMPPARREQMTEASRQRIISNFSKEQSINQLEELYESLLDTLPQKRVDSRLNFAQWGSRRLSQHQPNQKDSI